MRPRLLAALAAVLLFAGAARAAEPALPPAPARWVFDETGFLSPAARATLDGELEAFERAQGSQVLVAIFRQLPAGVTLEEWTQRVAESWRVGRARQDDGVVLFIFLADRLVRIEVGYGLEGALPDLRASRILREVLLPGLRTGDHDGAVLATARAIVAAIRGEYEPGPGAERHGDGVPLWLLLLLVIVVLWVLTAAARASFMQPSSSVCCRRSSERCWAWLERWSSSRSPARAPRRRSSARSTYPPCPSPSSSRSIGRMTIW